MNIKCPKCCGNFFPDWKFCSFHEKEYQEWNRDEYIVDEKCTNGHSDWAYGTLQMTNPPSFPKKEVYRCNTCFEVRLERSKNGRVRFAEYE